MRREHSKQNNVKIYEIVCTMSKNRKYKSRHLAKSNIFPEGTIWSVTVSSGQ